MPFVGIREANATINYQGTYGNDWSSSPYGSGYPTIASRLALDLSNVSSANGSYRSNGLPVRCFKDTFEVPTASWTVINGTL